MTALGTLFLLARHCVLPPLTSKTLKYLDHLAQTLGQGFYTQTSFEAAYGAGSSAETPQVMTPGIYVCLSYQQHSRDDQCPTLWSLRLLDTVAKATASHFFLARRFPHS